MKIIYPLCICIALMSGTAGATGFWGGDYLVSAATAWGGVLEASGRGGAIARHISDAKNADLPAFYDMVSTVAYNDTALTLFEAASAIRTAFSVMDDPMLSRRDARWHVALSGHILGNTAKFDRNDNSDFNVDTTGGGVTASMYVSDSVVVGVSYTRTMTDTNGNRVYTDATGDSITLFSQYTSHGGFFMNMGVLGGRIAWEVDKTIAGVSDDSAFDTDFMSGQLSGGYNIDLGRVTLTPTAQVRYSRIVTDKHIDAAAQSFEKWWHNELAALAAVKLGYDFNMTNVKVRPSISLGGGYDAISHGTDRIAVGVVGVGAYDMPVISPARLWFDGGLSLGVYGEMFALSFDYKMNARSDYMAHSGMINLKIAF